MTSLSQWLMVAAGGAIGASARHGVALLMLSTGWRFPFATLIVNIIGSFLLGAVYAHVQHQGLSESVRLFVGVGLLEPSQRSPRSRLKWCSWRLKASGGEPQ